MDKEVKALVLKLQDIVRKQTRGKYPNVNEALNSLQDYVQDTTASKSGLEDRLKELDDMLTKKSEKKKPFIDHIEKIRKALRVQRQATPKVTKPQEEKRKPPYSASSGRTTPLTRKSQQTKTSIKPPSSAPSQRKTLLPSESRDICRLKTENQYLIQTLDGLHKNIVGGDEMALSKLKTPKHIKDNQSIVEVEANVKEVTQKFHETKTEVEYVAYLLKELANVSQSTNNGDNSISLSHPENIGSLRDYETKDAKNTETSRNNPMQSVQKQKLAEHYANAGHVLKQMKEKEKLCEHAGTLLTYDNPSISDISDPNRPTKLAERFSELYDNHWKIAFENIEKEDPDISDKKIVGYLYGMLVDGYRFCKDVRQTQKSSLEDILFDPAGGIKTSQRRQKEEINTIFANYLSDVAKLSSNVSSAHMAKAFVMNENINDKYSQVLKPCEMYIQECVQLCWLMQVQTPPLCLDLKTKQGQTFDKICYKEYTKKGNKIAFVVWPALFLHENGPLLSKGTAQCQ